MKKVVAIFVVLTMVLSSSVFITTYADATNYAVGDHFQLFARDLYDNAGLNDPYGQTQAFDEYGTLDPVGQDRYGGGGWSLPFASDGQSHYICFHTGFNAINQGELYTLNSKAQGFYTKATANIVTNLQHGSWSAIVTYDGGKTTDPILVYDCTKEININGVNYNGWSVVDFDIGTFKNLESVKMYVADAGTWNWGVGAYQYAVSFDITGTADGGIVASPSPSPTATPTATPTPTPSPTVAPTSSPAADSFKLFASYITQGTTGAPYGTVTVQSANGIADPYSFGAEHFVFWRNFVAGDSQTFIPNANSLNGYMTQVAVQYPCYPGCTDMRAEVSYVEDSASKLATVNFTGTHADNLQTTENGETWAIANIGIGTYPNVQSVRIYEVIDGSPMLQSVSFTPISEINPSTPPTDGITAIGLADLSGSVDTVAEATSVANVTVTSASDKAGYLVVAVYGTINGKSKLVAVSEKNITAADYTSGVAVIPVNLDIPLSGISVKAMFWNSKDDITPVFAALSK